MGYIGDSSASAQSMMQDVIENGIWAARALVSYGSVSSMHCQECGDDIPEGRRQAVPGVKYCVQCQDYHSISVRVIMLTKML